MTTGGSSSKAYQTASRISTRVHLMHERISLADSWQSIFIRLSKRQISSQDARQVRRRNGFFVAIFFFFYTGLEVCAVPLHSAVCCCQFMSPTTHQPPICIQSRPTDGLTHMCQKSLQSFANPEKYYLAIQYLCILSMSTLHQDLNQGFPFAWLDFHTITYF